MHSDNVILRHDSFSATYCLGCPRELGQLPKVARICRVLPPSDNPLIPAKDTAAKGLDALSLSYAGCVGVPVSGLLGVPYSDSRLECLLQALPLALAAAKDAKGNAFKDAIELLLDVLEHVDNSGNIYDPDNLLAAALEALGLMHTDEPEVREALSTCQGYQ